MEAASPPKLEPESWRTWERTVYRPPYNAVGGALNPSVASIPLFPGFPGLGGPREATPSQGLQCCLSGSQDKTANYPLYLCNFIDWLTNQRSPFELARSGLLEYCLPVVGRAEPAMRVSAGVNITATYSCMCVESQRGCI